MAELVSRLIAKHLQEAIARTMHGTDIIASTMCGQAQLHEAP
jgi:hypothetical protein